MIECRILDTTTVTLDGVTVTGPTDVKGESLTVGTTTYGRGMILVDSTGSTRTMPLTTNQMEVLPYAVVIAVILGLMTGKYGKTTA